MAKLELDWQVPPFTETPAKRMGWIDSQVQEGERWQEGQIAFDSIGSNINLLSGRNDIDPNKRSSLQTNYLKYCIRKIVAVLADVRHIAIFGSDAKQFSAQCEQHNKVSKAVYQESQFPRAVRRAMQFGVVSGSSYIWPRARRDHYGFGELKIQFTSLGMLDVIPVQVPADNDVTGSYVTTICDFVPIAEAHARFPTYQSSLFPVGKRKYTSTASTRRMDLAERFRYGMPSTNWDGLYCEIRYTFIRDVRINTTGQKLPMGDPGASWFYEVPSLGEDIPDRVTKGGVVTTRKATAEDCMIYPYLRLMISSKGMKEPMYDGPAFDWHGEMPIAHYCVDDWPWEGLGCSLISDIASVERAKRGIERGIHQIAKHRLDPGLAYDRSAGVSSQTAETMDPFEERLRLGVDGDPEKVLRPMLPEHLLNVPEWEFKFWEMLKSMEESQLGLNDIGQLANMKLNVQSDAAEKMLEVVGPLVKDISYGMEYSTAKVGNMLKFMIPQWFDTQRIMQYVGADGVTEETLDFEPDSLVPAHMLDELVNMDKDIAIPSPSVYSKIERARKFAKNLRLISVPGKQHNITQMEEQLKWLQLHRGGAPVSFHTVAKKLNIENYGEIEGNTEREKWINEEKQKLELMAKAKELASAIMPAPEQGQQPGAGPGGGQKGSGGRPPSGHAAPKIKTKGASSGNPRTTVTESK